MKMIKKGMPMIIYLIALMNSLNSSSICFGHVFPWIPGGDTNDPFASVTVLS